MTPKKKCQVFALVSLLVGIVFSICVVCSFLLLGSTSVGSGLGIISIACAFSGFAVAYVSFVDANRLYCPKCGKKYKFENVAWQVGTTTEEENKITADVDFDIVCAYCGSKREYTRKYTVAYRDNNGKIHENNLANVIRKQYKN